MTSRISQSYLFHSDKMRKRTGVMICINKSTAETLSKYNVFGLGFGFFFFFKFLEISLYVSLTLRE